jgi:hypothetical protein
MARKPSRLALDKDAVRDGIHDRWSVLDWNAVFPWWRKPGKARILLYADASIRFSGGPFLGLQYVTTLLTTRAYPYIDVDISSAHRDGTDPTATIAGAKKLTDLDIVTKFDEIWFFGINSQPALNSDEIGLLNQFMSAPKFGGVLVTGDHANLGRGITGQIPRAGTMRQYPAPDAISPGWNTTLEDGPDAGATFDFNDQSDDRPQNIRYRRYQVPSAAIFQRRQRPHPVLCGPDGPIDVLPDHQHEGEAVAPVPAAGDANWPSKAGHQERPQVIAWGRIKDPAASKHGQEIGVISAYDGHNVDVGRIVADSTWHHWFDINLTGIAAPPSAYAGFDDTAAGQAALKKIDAYFLNCAVWLAPPSVQAAMRNFAWWSILWTDRVAELSLDTPILKLGAEAIDALGRQAPRCTASQWVFDWPIFKEKIPHWEWPQLQERFQLTEVPIEQFVAGGILRQLMIEVGPQREARFPDRAPADEQLERAMLQGVEQGMAALSKQLLEEAKQLGSLVNAGFRLQPGR